MTGTGTEMVCVYRNTINCLFLLTGLFVSFLAYAEVKLPALISDNMVLQQNTQSHLWGWADPGERIQINIAQRTFKTRTNDYGNWRFYLPQLPAGVYELNIRGTSDLTDTSSEITVKNVAVGEVWLAAGQSNMAWPVKQSLTAEQTIATAKYPEMRFFRVAQHTALEPLQEVAGKWEVITPQTVGDASAVAYYFARRLQQNLNTPVGIIQAVRSGTRITAWTGVQALAAEPALQPLLDEMDRQLYPIAGDAQASSADAVVKPVRSGVPTEQYGLENPNTPTVLYNAMIAPLQAYTLQGVLWYQGESDVHDARQYQLVFPHMIEQWRQGWQRQLPFLFVQLANFEFAADSKRQKWAELRAAQAVTHASVAASGMVTAIDVGEADNVHPPNKTAVGERLAGWALARVYGQDVAWQGPEYVAFTREPARTGGQQIRLQFDYATGLYAHGKITAFELAGSEGTYHRAQAAIEEDSIVLYSKQVAEPKWLRYAWRDNPLANIYNEARLPLKPFKLQLR